MRSGENSVSEDGWEILGKRRDFPGDKNDKALLEKEKCTWFFW